MYDVLTTEPDDEIVMSSINVTCPRNINQGELEELG